MVTFLKNFNLQKQSNLRKIHMNKRNSACIGRLIIYALCFIHLATITRAQLVPLKLLNQNINAQFDSETQHVIPIKTTVIYTPPIKQQYRAVQAVYPKVNNRFQKKIGSATFADKHRVSENIQKLVNKNEENNVKDQSLKIQSKQQTQIKFKANFPYSFMPLISDSNDITKQIYAKQVPAQNNRFNKALSTDWFVNKILKRKQVQQSQKQRLHPNPNPKKQKKQIKEQIKKDQKSKNHRVIDQPNPTIINPGVIVWKASQKFQPINIHQYDRNEDIPIIKHEQTIAKQKKDESSLKIHQKVPEVNIIKENTDGNTKLHVSTINDLPNFDKPTKKDLQRPDQNVNGNLKIFEIPKKISDQSYKDKETSNNNQQVQNDRSGGQNVWLVREKYIFIILSVFSLGIIILGKQQTQRANVQSRARSQYSTIDVKDSNQINEQIDQIEKAQFQESQYESLRSKQRQDLL